MESLIKIVKQCITEYLTELGEVKNIMISEVRWVRIDQINGLPEEKKVYSGKPFKINLKGEVGIMEKLKNGRQNETLEFQGSLDCIFNAEEEEFTLSGENNLIIYRQR